MSAESADLTTPRPADCGTPATQRAGRLLLAIPTTGRAPVLGPTLAHLARQTRRPDLLLLSVAAPEDAPEALYADLPFPVERIVGPKGGCPQRNRILDRLTADDILLLIDDDFLMAPDYLERLEALFSADPDLVLATGTVVADGVSGPGLSHDEGVRLLAAAAPPADPMATTPIKIGYGCNFALRAAPVLAHGLRFDEALPLYSWLEDVDFSAQLRGHGNAVRGAGLIGVHLGTKMARSPGKRLGYSQIANPIYLVRKGTMRRGHARQIIMRNIAANLYYTPVPRAWTDSRGRLRGNLLALRDWGLGRLSPGRVHDL